MYALGMLSPAAGKAVVTAATPTAAISAALMNTVGTNFGVSGLNTMQDSYRFEFRVRF